MSDESDYALGYSPGEHARLDRQAQRMHAASTRFFRNAGLAGGPRVLDLGSGIGDVSMLARARSDRHAMRGGRPNRRVRRPGVAGDF